MGILPQNLLALVSKGEVDLSQEAMMGVAKRYVLTHLYRCNQSVSDVLRLEDLSAGLLKFVYRDDRFKDESSLFEVIEKDFNHSEIKITIPGDFGGRAELLKEKLLAASQDMIAGRKGTLIHFDPRIVYRSTLRYILKQFVTGKQKKEDVVCLSQEDVGLIRFQYRKGNFKDTNARIEVVSAGKNVARIWVTLPDLTMDKQILLQDEIVAAIQSDLGEGQTEEEGSQN